MLWQQSSLIFCLLFLLSFLIHIFLGFFPLFLFLLLRLQNMHLFFCLFLSPILVLADVLAAQLPALSSACFFLPSLFFFLLLCLQYIQLDIFPLASFPFSLFFVCHATLQLYLLLVSFLFAIFFSSYSGSSIHLYLPHNSFLFPLLFLLLWLYCNQVYFLHITFLIPFFFQLL